MPRNRSELYRLYKQMKAVLFHNYVARSFYEISGLDEWFYKKYDRQNIAVNRLPKYVKCILQKLSKKFIERITEVFSILTKKNFSCIPLKLFANCIKFLTEIVVQFVTKHLTAYFFLKQIIFGCVSTKQ